MSSEDTSSGRLKDVRAFSLWLAALTDEATEEEKYEMLSEMYGWDRDLIGTMISLQGGMPVEPIHTTDFRVSRAVFKRWADKQRDAKTAEQGVDYAPEV